MKEKTKIIYNYNYQHVVPKINIYLLFHICL